MSAFAGNSTMDVRLDMVMGPLMHDFFFVVLVVNFGPLPKNSGPNLMSFKFLIGGTLGPSNESDPSVRKSWIRHWSDQVTKGHDEQKREVIA